MTALQIEALQGLGEKVKNTVSRSMKSETRRRERDKVGGGGGGGGNYRRSESHNDPKTLDFSLNFFIIFFVFSVKKDSLFAVVKL